MDLLDDVLVLGGIGWLVIRQFQWRSAAGMARIGAVLLGAGVVVTVQESLASAARWTWFDGAVLALELLLAAALGVAMGGRYRLRSDGGSVLARLDRSGIVLWAGFVLIRLAAFGVAHALGARLVLTTGALLLAFGANRLATGIVVRRRIAGAATPIRLGSGHPA